MKKLNINQIISRIEPMRSYAFGKKENGFVILEEEVI